MSWDVHRGASRLLAAEAKRRALDIHVSTANDASVRDWCDMRPNCELICL